MPILLAGNLRNAGDVGKVRLFHVERASDEVCLFHVKRNAVEVEAAIG